MIPLSELTIDWFSAALAAGCVSPAVGIIDRAFTQNAAGTHTIRQSVSTSLVTLLTRPHQYFRKPDFWLLCFLYTSTYGTANTFDTFFTHSSGSSSRRSGEEKTYAQQMIKLLGVSTVNTAASMWKDKMFAQMCRPSDRLAATGPPPRMPPVVYAIWFVRDLSVMTCSFSVPEVLGRHLHDTTGMDGHRAYMLAQFLCPVLSMFWATPLHLIGLDMYNNRHHDLTQRLTFLTRTYWPSLMAKMVRIVPPFAVGPACNKHFRERFRSTWLENEK